ncbi:hypothetical protein AB0E59_06105 [Lentzea sp. NPDC034063]|uniref:hypothetical protein n=1 Tax=unclassified Lentzea TaxID=2643253 RepID=UPI0033F4CE19
MKKTTTLFALGGVLVAASACDRGPAPSTSPTETTSVAKPAELARTNAGSAYRGMWEGFADAGTTADPDSQLLGQHAAGAALDKLKRSLRSDREKGLVSKGKPILDPKVSDAQPADVPTRVVITDCGDSTNWLKYRKDSDLLADDVPGGRRLIKAAVDKQPDGTWKVSDYAVHEIGSC